MTMLSWTVRYDTETGETIWTINYSDGRVAQIVLDTDDRFTWDYPAGSIVSQKGSVDRFSAAQGAICVERTRDVS